MQGISSVTRKKFERSLGKTVRHAPARMQRAGHAFGERLDPPASEKFLDC